MRDLSFSLILIDEKEGAKNKNVISVGNDLLFFSSLTETDSQGRRRFEYS